jgi:ABC-type lipoprotein export system ATPase subunit/GNAT superfamily N-acetyltransferase
MTKPVQTSAPPSRRQLKACAPFGLELRQDAPRPIPGAGPAAETIRTSLGRGQIAFVSGPSGSGKSTALRALAEQLRARDQRVIVHTGTAPPDRALIDIFGLDVTPDRTLRLLASFGLAEPALMARAVGELSEGQRHRAQLARTFFDAMQTRTSWVLVDEFASVLDRVTAMGLGATIRRAARHAKIRLVCASAHDDLLATLRPDLTIAFGLDDSWRVVMPAEQSCPGLNITIEPGTQADMDALLPHHYIAGRPATRVGFLRAVDKTYNNLAGVLVISMPTLCGVWRQQAWPGRYAGRDRKSATRRINTELRCISRVIIDPRYRGLGLATRLVRTYLDHPLTPATEAVAAMGRFCPFFERAGMTAYRVPMHAADARLADAIEAARFEPWMLADPGRAQTLLAHPLVAAELYRWARARRLVEQSDQTLCRMAGARLSIESMAYAAVTPPNTIAPSAHHPGGGIDERQEQTRFE